MRKLLVLTLMGVVFLFAADLVHAVSANAPVHILFQDSCNCSYLELKRTGTDIVVTFRRADGRLESVTLKSGTDYVITWASE
jgi:hypothetical protein